MTFTSLLPLVLYAAAAAAYFAHFSKPEPRSGRLATALLGGAVLAHTFLIGMPKKYTIPDLVDALVEHFSAQRVEA